MSQLVRACAQEERSQFTFNSVETPSYTDVGAHPLLANCRDALSVALLLLGLGGCIGFDAISNEVRPGGTVLLAVDAVRHQMPDPARVQATFFDSDGAEHRVSLRHMLRVQPDPVSGFGIGAYSTNHGIYAGQKLAVVDMVDPDTQQPPVAPAMASGEGLLELYMPDIESSSVHALSIIPSDALPGQPANDLRVLQDPGNIRPLHTAWLLQASPQPHVRIETVASDIYDRDVQLAGALFQLRFPVASFTADDFTPGFSVTKLSSDPNLQLSWQARPDQSSADHSIIAITLRNPHGFYREAQQLYAAGKQSLFDDLSSIAIAWLANKYLGGSEIPFDWASPPIFFDIYGKTVAGLSATIVKGS